ncbi:MAG: 30S ribosomal protein S18, partial [Candidatus Pacebacteria bacterium]|nr:30S ribosomal protein S18 [Candidatus Paceibacterota bacterium]
RMLARRRTDVTAKNQRKLAEAIKRARFMGLLPYIAK